MNSEVTYTARDIVRWLFQTNRRHWLRLGVLLLAWSKKVAADNRGKQTCTGCSMLMTEGKGINVSAFPDQEVWMCPRCLMANIYARLDRYLNRKGDILELEQARDNLHEMLTGDRQESDLAYRMWVKGNG